VVAYGIQVVLDGAGAALSFRLLLVGPILAKPADVKVFCREVDLFLNFATLSA